MIKITHQDLEQIKKFAKSINKDKSISVSSKKKSEKIIKLIDDKYLNVK
jgi:hypothetical protein